MTVPFRLLAGDTSGSTWTTPSRTPCWPRESGSTATSTLTTCSTACSRSSLCPHSRAGRSKHSVGFDLKNDVFILIPSPLNWVYRQSILLRGSWAGRLFDYLRPEEASWRQHVTFCADVLISFLQMIRILSSFLPLSCRSPPPPSQRRSLCQPLIQSHRFGPGGHGPCL